MILAPCEVRALPSPPRMDIQDERSNWIEARSWLVATLASAPPPSGTQALRSVLAPYLETSFVREAGVEGGETDESAIQLTLIEMLCEHKRGEIGAIIASCPDTLRTFFSEGD